MATLIATANGNLTSSSTWATIATASNSQLDSEAANTALTTSYVESATITPGAVTIDAIAVKVATRAASPSGTISVRLAQGGSTVSGTEVTINVSDIIGTDLLMNGWLLFKFAAPVLLVAATNYTVSAKTSVSSQVNLYRNATAGNWSRMLRTTTTAAPSAGDDMFILGEWTAAATMTTRTVTMDSTANTDYGSGSTTLVGFGISNGGTLTWGTTAATAYILQLSAIMGVWQGGLHNMGTVGTPIPRDSSHTLQFDCAADGDFGLHVYNGNNNGQGQSPISASSNPWVLLNANAAAAATSVTTATQLSAKSGADIVFTGTTVNSEQSEVRVMNGDAGATSLAITVGLTNAHSGTSPTQGEIGSLGRNCVIKSVSTSFMAYVVVEALSVVDFDWVLFQNLGHSVAGKRGVEILTTAAGSFSATNCVFRDFDNYGFYAQGSAHDGWTLDGCVFYNVGKANGGSATIEQTTGANWTVTNCLFAGVATGTQPQLDLQDVGGNVTNNHITGGQGDLIKLNELGGTPVNISGNTLHSCSSGGGAGFNLAKSNNGGTIGTTSMWRVGGNSNSGGIKFTVPPMGLTFQNVDVFGCTFRCIYVPTTSMCDVTFRTCTFSGETNAATNCGMSFGTNPAGGRFTFENCTFGVVSGVHTAFTTADIQFNTSLSTIYSFVELYLINTVLASSAEFDSTNSLGGRSFIARQKVDQSAGVNTKTYQQLGVNSLDSVVFHTAAPSEKMAPSGATAAFRLRSAVKRVPVGSGQSCTISVWTNKSVAYAGSNPRIIVLSDLAAGISEATVATNTGTAGTWVQSSGTVGPVTENCWLQFCVEVDGSAGQVNVDDWAASIA